MAESNADMLRKRRGRASTVLTTGDGSGTSLGDSSGATTAAAKILGN